MANVSLGRGKKRGNGSHTKPTGGDMAKSTGALLQTTHHSSGQAAASSVATTPSFGLEGLIGSLNISTDSVMLNDKLMSEMGKLFFSSLVKFNNILQAHGNSTSSKASTSVTLETHSDEPSELPQDTTDSTLTEQVGEYTTDEPMDNNSKAVVSKGTKGTQKRRHMNKTGDGKSSDHKVGDVHSGKSSDYKVGDAHSGKSSDYKVGDAHSGKSSDHKVGDVHSGKSSDYKVGDAHSGKSRGKKKDRKGSKWHKGQKSHDVDTSCNIDFDNAPTPNVLQESELLYMDTLAESKQRLNLNIYRFVDMCINPRVPTHQEGESPSASYDYSVDSYPSLDYNEVTPKTAAVEITKITTTLEDDGKWSPTNKAGFHFASPMDTKGLFLKAAFSGDVEAMRKMSDVSLDYVDDVGRNAIHYASASGSVECVRYLLERGINIDEVDKKGWTALHIAVSKNYTNVAKLLISSGCNIFTKLKHRCAPSRLVDVYSFAIHFAAIKGNVELTKVLIENGATCNDVDSSNMTPLHYAACRGNSEYLGFLIELGADVTIKDINGRTPFHSAALSGSMENMHILIDKFGFINEPDIWSLTPLALANLRGHTELYSFLSSISGELENADSEMTHVLSSTIAAALQEPNVDQIHRCVCRIGADVCKTIFDLTLQIERNGGVLTSDGKRRRTSGGIFFTLLKELYLNGIISKDDYNYIRAAENEKRSAKVIEKRNRLKNTLQTEMKKADGPSGKRNAPKGTKNTNKGGNKKGTIHPVKSATQT